MEQNNLFGSGQNQDGRGDLWYVDNYILLKDYYDRTISRIAARCVRSGNIAMEEYPFYGYILDVLEEISETGDYIVEHANLHPYVEKKIAGGLNALKKNLNEFKTELKNNASPEMIKQDKDELDRIKEALGAVDKANDPTVGAGMSMDQVVEKLLHNQQNSQQTAAKTNQPQPRPQTQNQAARPQTAPQTPNQRPQQPQGQNQQPRQPGTQAAPQNARPAQPNSSSPFNNGTK